MTEFNDTIIEAVQTIWNHECKGAFVNPEELTHDMKAAKLAGLLSATPKFGVQTTIKGLKALFAAKQVPVAG